MNNFMVIGSINNEEVYIAYNSILESYEWVENRNDAYIFKNAEDYDELLDTGLLIDKGLDDKPRIETV